MRQLKFRGQVFAELIRQVRNGKLVEVLVLDAFLLLLLLFIRILLIFILLDEVRSEHVEHAAVERREGVGVRLRWRFLLLVLLVVSFGFVLLVFMMFVFMLVPVEINQ